MTRLYFINGEPVTKSELLINAEKQTEKTKSKNKRRLREGLTFRLAKDYSSWGTFIGGCQPIGHKSVKHVSLEGIIANALKHDHITEPCVAIFRLKNKNFIYSDRSDQPIIINGHVLVDRGGTWRWYVDEDTRFGLLPICRIWCNGRVPRISSLLWTIRIHLSVSLPEAPLSNTATNSCFRKIDT